jgi:signal transduction histidine kinase/ActR/RegA family two-component response regulator
MCREALEMEKKRGKFKGFFTRKQETSGDRIAFLEKQNRELQEKLARLEETNQLSEERLLRAEMASKSGNWELHLDTGTMFGSIGARKLYGIEEPVMTYELVKDVPLPEYRPLLDKAVMDLIEKDIPYNVEFRIQNKVTGEIIDIHSICEYDKERRVLFGSIQDISDEKRTGELIRTKSSNLARLLEITLELLEKVDRKSLLSRVVQGVSGIQAMETGAIYLLSGDMLYLETANPDLPENFPEEFRRTEIHDHIHIKQVIRENQPVIISDTSKAIFTPGEELIVKGRKLGSLFYLPLVVSKEVVGVLIFGTLGKPHEFTEDEIDICRTLANIGSMALENSVLVENLTRAKEKAEESDKLKTAFLHNISHEIRTPLNAIIGFSSFLDEPDLSPAERQSYIDVIFQSNSQLLSIINDILNISLIEAGQVMVNESEINLSQVVNNISENFRPEASRKNLDLRVKVNIDEKSSRIVTDEIKITHILENLISNAIKFTSSGFIEVGTSIEGRFVEVYVEDSGIGIESAEQKKIFERFYQVEKSLSKVYTGMGLGLTIADAFVTLLGGTMTLSSTPGKGSRFSFIVPCKNIRKSVAEAPVEKIDADIFAGKELTILVAEDEESNFALIHAILKPLGINVLRAWNGREAIEIIRENEDIEMVLMDIKMPEVGGLEATSEILKFRPGLTVIAQTAYAHPSDIEKAAKAGCRGYLSKPFNRNQLLELLGKHISPK